jgi:hypothetical protein
VVRWTGYILSLPERALRSASALAGGILRGAGEVGLPAALRRTRLYTTLVDSTLRFLIEQVGQVEGAYTSETQLAADFLARRTAGNGIEWIGILAFRASPVWVMAALADLSGAGRHLVREIAESLKRDGLLPLETQMETVDQLLDGLEQTAGKVAETINTPPLDVDGLRREWDAIRREASKIPANLLPSIDQLEVQWRDLIATAESQNRSVLEISALMTLAAVRNLPGNVRWLFRCMQSMGRSAGGLVTATVLDHYQASLARIRAEGYGQFWMNEFRPYLTAAARQFSPQRGSLTQRMLHR